MIFQQPPRLKLYSEMVMTNKDSEKCTQEYSKQGCPTPPWGYRYETCDEELNPYLIYRRLLSNKLVIILATMLFAASSAAYLYSFPEKYRVFFTAHVPPINMKNIDNLPEELLNTAQLASAIGRGIFDEDLISELNLQSARNNKEIIYTDGYLAIKAKAEGPFLFIERSAVSPALWKQIFVQLVERLNTLREKKWKINKVYLQQNIQEFKVDIAHLEQLYENQIEFDKEHVVSYLQISELKDKLQRLEMLLESDVSITFMKDISFSEKRVEPKGRIATVIAFTFAGFFLGCFLSLFIEYWNRCKDAMN